MGNITETPVWEESVFQVETTTPLLGGNPEINSNGTATAGYLNVAQQQLANRTQYLKDTIENTDIDVGGLSDRVQDVEVSLTQHIGSRGVAHSNATQTEAGFMSAADKTKLNGVETGAQVNVATNLAEGTRTAATVPVTSSTGTAATLSAATISLAGVMSSADKTKLDSVATGAQVNTVTSVAGKTGAVTLVKADVGLGNVDNTSDVNKPVSTAQQAALNLKADLASPPLTGTPTAPTATVGTNNTQIATTAFVLANQAVSTRQFLHVQDQKTAGTSGGNSVATTAPATSIRTLNTTVLNQISGASLNGSSQITLPAGSYKIDARSVFSNNIGNSRLVLVNVTDAVNFPLYSITGTTGGAGGNWLNTLSGIITITATKLITLNYRTTLSATDGLGTVNNASYSPVPEVYSDVLIERIS